MDFHPEFVKCKNFIWKKHSTLLHPLSVIKPNAEQVERVVLLFY